MPTLVLLRHAKSAYPDGVQDHDRPLNARGLREAPLAGELIAERVQHFDQAFVSTGLRAHQTWLAISPHLDVGSSAHLADLYLASCSELLDMVQRVASTVDALLLVGHNEGLEELASLLSGVPVTMKTSTFAILQSGMPWAQWEPGTAALAEVVVAR